MCPPPGATAAFAVFFLHFPFWCKRKLSVDEAFIRPPRYVAFVDSPQWNIFSRFLLAPFIPVTTPLLAVMQLSIMSGTNWGLWLQRAVMP